MTLSVSYGPNHSLKLMPIVKWHSVIVILFKLVLVCLLNSGNFENKRLKLHLHGLRTTSPWLAKAWLRAAVVRDKLGLRIYYLLLHYYIILLPKNPTHYIQSTNVVLLSSQVVLDPGRQEYTPPPYRPETKQKRPHWKLVSCTVI